MIAALLAPQGLLGALLGLLSYPAMARLGELSYSVYFVHMLPLTIVVHAANKLALPPALYGSLVIAVVLPLTFVLSLLTHRWIERPGIRAGASLSSWRNNRGELT